MKTIAKRLWTCPRCGHRFVTKNLWHSCGRYLVADHFRGKDDEVRLLFDRLKALARRHGAVTVYAQKTRIVFQGRVRFASAVPRKHWLDIGVWLTRRVDHPTLRRVEALAPRSYVHSFRLRQRADIDTGLAEILAAAAAVGRQEHLSTRAHRPR